MKKLLALVSAALLMCLAGCSTNNGTQGAKQYDALKIVGLKGPTTMGIVKMMEDNTSNTYEVLGTADEASVKIIKGEVDVALVPANLASVLYNKTQGQIQIAGINTLGVLYVLEKGNTVNSISDLKGKKVISTGKGTTPEYVLNYLLSKNGIDDVDVEYKSEATEVAAELNSGKADIAVLPQPYVTSVIDKNADIRIALDLTQEWNKVDSSSALVTGVIVIRKEIAETRKADIDAFLSEYKQSVEFVNNDDEAAALVAKQGIATEEIARKAIPYCNIVLIEGEDMKSKLSGYLKVLYEQNPASVGGTLPDEGIYYSK